MAKAAAKRSSGPTGKLKAHGRSLADFKPLLPAEKKLLEACRIGEMAMIGTGKRPKKMTNDNRVRPGIIRLLALQGDDRAPVHEKGIEIAGAWIDGDLDLQACHCIAPFKIHDCRVDGNVVVVDAILSSFSLEATAINSLQGDGLKATGDFELHHGFSASGEVRLLGARIGGDFSCRDGKFRTHDGDALSCDRSDIVGNVFLDNEFHATGVVRLLGATIGGDLSCEGGNFRPANGHALVCDGAKVNGRLLFRDVKQMNGKVSVTGVEVNYLVDDFDSWHLAPNLVLDGFQYEWIVGGPTDAATRILWLKKQPDQHLNEDFKPQPWEQLVKVLREMGHDNDARVVAIEKQRMLRAAGKIKGVLWPLHWLYGLLAGYGHKPLNTVVAMLVVWILASVVFVYAGKRGVMAPSSPIIHANLTINEACGGASGAKLTQWTECKDLPQEYTTFNAYLYSLDLILPLVDLQQDSDWAPIVTADDGVTWTWYRAFNRAVMWFEILFGWAASLLLVAVLGNLVKKD